MQAHSRESKTVYRPNVTTARRGAVFVASCKIDLLFQRHLRHHSLCFVERLLPTAYPGHFRCRVDSRALAVEVGIALDDLVALRGSMVYQGEGGQSSHCPFEIRHISK